MNAKSKQTNQTLFPGRKAAFPGDVIHSQNLETRLCQGSGFSHGHVVTDPCPFLPSLQLPALPIRTCLYLWPHLFLTHFNSDHLSSTGPLGNQVTDPLCPQHLSSVLLSPACLSPKCQRHKQTLFGVICLQQWSPVRSLPALAHD